MRAARSLNTNGKKRRLLRPAVPEFVLTLGGIAAGAALLIAGAVAAALPEPAANACKTRYFFCRLVLPRAIIPQLMTLAERQIMEEHVAYWEAQAEAGRVLIIGSVKDKPRAWGLLILRARSEAEAERILLMDPAISAKGGIRYQIHPLLNLFNEDY